MSAIEIDTFDHLSRFREIVHFQTRRHGGVSTGAYRSLNLGYSSGDRRDRVLKNRILLAERLGMELDRFVFSRQVHGAQVRLVTAEDAGNGVYDVDPVPDADAMITRERNIVLCMKTADCIPILCYDPRQRAVAVIHAGWKGTAQRIVGKTVQAMCERFGSRPSDLVAGIGAGVGMCCYRVHRDIVEALRRTLPDTPSDLFCRQTGSDAFLVDLKTINKLHLAEAGVPEARIEINANCSICNPAYFSARAGQSRYVGQMCAGIALL